MLSNKIYDTLKTIALIIAPIATFIGAVCIIWGVPYSEQITATLAAFNTLLGSLITKSSHDYNKPYEINTDDLVYIDDEEIEVSEVQ